LKTNFLFESLLESSPPYLTGRCPLAQPEKPWRTCQIIFSFWVCALSPWRLSSSLLPTRRLHLSGSYPCSLCRPSCRLFTPLLAAPTPPSSKPRDAASALYSLALIPPLKPLLKPSAINGINPLKRQPLPPSRRLPMPPSGPYKRRQPPPLLTTPPPPLFPLPPSFLSAVTSTSLPGHHTTS
jgi:hypothetical protein